MKFLEQIGYEDIFNETEINEVKSMFDKTSHELSKGHALLDQISKYADQDPPNYPDPPKSSNFDMKISSNSNQKFTQEF